MVNADLIITQDTSVWIQFQLALYIEHPDAFPAGTDVIQDKSNGSSLLVSDGSGANAKALTNAQINSLITNGKPTGYVSASKSLPAGAPILVYLNAKVKSIITAGKNDRDAYQSSLSNPLTPNI